MRREHVPVDRSRRREADFPTQQDRAQATARLPVTHGDGRRSQGDCSPPVARSQASFGLICIQATEPRGQPLNAAHEEAVAPVRLKKRPLFVRAAGGRKIHSALFTLQALSRPDDEASAPRVGFTVTKKVGGAVERNRIKRRLRELVRTAADLELKPTHDYVIVARRAVLDASFPALAAGLGSALVKVHGQKRAQRPRGADADRRTSAERRDPLLRP